MIELSIAGMLFVFGAYYIYNYRKDTKPVWFKIYAAINLVFLIALALVLIYLVVQRLA